MQVKRLRCVVQFISVFLVLGLAACVSRREITLDPESQDFYETAYLIMTKQEKNIFNHLPDKESRKEFIEDFWAKRDPNPDTEENEYKEEFFRRIEYANKRFNEGTPGWKTDRGRIYILLGPPDKFDEIFTHSEVDHAGNPIRGSILLWIYYRYNLGIKFVDASGMNHFKMDPYYGIAGSLPDAIEMAKLGVSYENTGPGSKLVNFKAEYDRDKKEIVVLIPVKNLVFVEEEGILKADFEFEFHIYERKGLKKDRFKAVKSFAEPENDVLEMDEIVFTFPYETAPGRYYLDVIIIGKKDIGKTRRIFEIKV